MRSEPSWLAFDLANAEPAGWTTGQSPKRNCSIGGWQGSEIRLF
jgi:hypothetical protein